jgi:DNA polymerase
MKTLSIDIETYSDVSLGKCGVYKYAESPDFEILLFGYAVDGGEVKTIDLAQGERLPPELIDALVSDEVIKWAYNANFERVCLSRHLRDMEISLDPFFDDHPLSMERARFLNPKSWRCSMIWASTMGLPRSLEGVGAVLGLEKQKLTEGKDLIKYFCVPCTPTKSNGGRTRNFPRDALDRWEAFKRYNIRDVETEMGIKERLSKFPVPDFVWDEYHIDQEINDRGVRLDMDLVEKAIEMDTRSRAELTAAMKELTSLDNPNSVQQMKQWLALQGVEVESLGKKEVAKLIESVPPRLKEALELRQQLSKSSVKKYQTMQRAVCDDGRARGMFAFYGANRTGRWAGRLIQLQNLPQNHLEDLSSARALVKSGNFEAVKLLYEDVPDTLSQLIRTAFIPKDGMLFYVADFSAIEARVIAWYAGEKWRQKVFEEGGDIYCASASQMFHVPVVKHGVNGHLRQKGKIAELALGYGGSVGALKAMGALEMGLSEDELPPLVDAWRQTNPHIVQFWWDVDRAVMNAVRYHIPSIIYGLKIECRSGMLFIRLALRQEARLREAEDRNKQVRRRMHHL